MSIDSHDVAKHEKNRGLPDVCRKIKRANEVFRELGVQTTASVTASKLIDDYDKLPAFLTELGFKSCTFSYPLSSLASSYLSFSDSSLVSYKTEELIQVFEKIKQMKQRSGFPVVNPTESLTEMQRHLRREPEKFGCLGGHKYFYLDWNLNLYRCHFWETPMCNIYEFDASKLIRDGCTALHDRLLPRPERAAVRGGQRQRRLEQPAAGPAPGRGEERVRRAQPHFAEGGVGRAQVDWRRVG